MGSMEWKWSKDPKPEQLLKLPEAVREASFQAMKSELPNIVRFVISRIRSRGTIVKDGREAPIPGYSEAYERKLKKEGRSLLPDYTYSGGMLDHVRGRVKVVGEQIVGIASPYGRINNRKRTGTGKKAGMVYREPYSYPHRRTGKPVHVKGQWIRTRGQTGTETGGERRNRTLVYNAHLMNLLVSRKGHGKWLPGNIATHHILALTPSELAKWLDLMQKSYMRAAAKVLAKTAGK